MSFKKLSFPEIAWFSLVLVAFGITSTCRAATNPTVLEERFSKDPPAATLSGDAKILDFGSLEFESSGRCAQLNAATDINQDGDHSGRVTVALRQLKGSEGQWFRFSFRGLPARDFKINPGGELAMRVKFLGAHNESYDGLVKDLYPLIETDRRDLEKNGNGFINGATVWTLYSYDFRVPFNDVDTIQFSVAFKGGTGQEPYGSFFVDDLKVEKISLQLPRPTSGSTVPLDASRLMSLGGRWFYYGSANSTTNTAPRHYDSTNLDRLAYKIGDKFEFPFAQNKGVWLAKGSLNPRGEIVKEDSWVANPVSVDFEGSDLVIHTIDIPNHPTGQFPQPYGNHSYIQMKNITVKLPLEAKQNPDAQAMTYRNGNGALPMGPIGIAVNGVVFYNPFDAQMTEAVSIMDRCCGHPDPSNLYHYHKYPVCARSPFEDVGSHHSPLIGWAYDGFPVYGPYESNGEMAMNSKSNPLNAFNIHYDADRGWHYHATPGKFPYIIGGFWGSVNRDNLAGAGRPPGNSSNRFY